MEALTTGTTVKKTVISCNEATRSRDVSRRHSIEFRRLRKSYEKQLKEKARHLKEEIISTSYRASIADEDLMVFIAAGRVYCSCIDELTESHIVEYVDNRSTIKATGEVLHLVDHADKTVGVQMHIFEPEDRVWSLRRTYSQALKAAGYDELIELKPHIAIQHFLQRLKSAQL